MRAILIAACSLLYVALGAGSTGAQPSPPKVESRSALAAVLHNYLSCRPKARIASEADLERLRLCVGRALAPRESPKRVNRFVAWLLMVAPAVTLIRDCTEADLELHIGFSERTNDAVCFEAVLGGLDGRPIKGAAFFNTDGRTAYLYSFNYWTVRR